MTDTRENMQSMDDDDDDDDDADNGAVKGNMTNERGGGMGGVSGRPFIVTLRLTSIQRGDHLPHHSYPNPPRCR